MGLMTYLPLYHVIFTSFECQCIVYGYFVVTVNALIVKSPQLKDDTRALCYIIIRIATINLHKVRPAFFKLYLHFKKQQRFRFVVFCQCR